MTVTAIGSRRAGGPAFDGLHRISKRCAFDGKEVSRDRNTDVGVVREQARCWIDFGDCNVAAVLAEEQVLAIRRIGDTYLAAVRVRVSYRTVALQDSAGSDVEDLDGSVAIACRRAHGEDGGRFAVGIERHGLGADPNAEID